MWYYYSYNNKRFSNNNDSILYHGTNNEFDPKDFKVESESKNNYGILGNIPTKRNGIFFSNSLDFAKQYGNRIIKGHLNIQNPAIINEDLQYEFTQTLDAFQNRDIWIQAKFARHPWLLFEGELGKLFINFLKEQGYDGAIFEESVPNNDKEYSGTTYVAFDPSQIVIKE